MKSIRTRLVGYFMLVIIITVFVLEALIIHVFKQNYYKNLEDNLSNQAYVCSELYTKYFSDSDLQDNVLNDVDTFWKQSPAEVQIYDKSGELLMDSMGVISNGSAPDVTEALNGKKGKRLGSYNSEANLAISYPLKNSKGKIVGAIRLIASLRDVNKAINHLLYILIAIGSSVIIAVGLLAFFLCNTIVKPLNRVTAIAKKMAKGNYAIKSKKKYDDEVGELSDTLNYMADEINKKDQLKNEFFSSVSHELRTPLTSIKGWAVTLRESNFQEKEIFLDGLEIIENESDRLTAMVDELLNYSRYASCKITIEYSLVDIQKIMEHIKKQLIPRAKRENITFMVSYDDHIPNILSDENRLKQVFINLLDNAFNFTPSQGTVNFNAYCSENFITFIVKDTGCGISKDELPRIKERFYKGKSSKSKNGIGLSVCDEIIGLLNGTFEIKSELNKGTEVIVTLPIK